MIINPFDPRDRYTGLSVFSHILRNRYSDLTDCTYICTTYVLGMLKPFFGKPIFGCWKPVFNWFSVFTNLHKIYYYIRQIILCITHCNVCTHKAVSTLICSFSRFSLNEAMNIVYTVCFKEKLYLIKIG